MASSSATTTGAEVTIMQFLLGMVPIAYFVLSAFISCAALNVSQPHRIYFLFPILLPAVKSFVSIHCLDLVAPGLTQLLGHTVLIHIIHITSVLYLRKWKLHPEEKVSGWDFHAAYKIWGNPQLLNTHHGTHVYHHTNAKPSRIRFLGHRCLHLAAFYLTNRYIITPVFPDAFMPLSITSFSPEREKYLRRLVTSHVTVYESLLRAVLAVRWIWLNIFGLHLAQTAVAVLFSIILRWDEPWEWPSLFGSPLEAYSLRRFWARFWHRIIVPPYTTYGRWISRRVCGLKPESAAEKVFISIFVFLVSGVAHSLVTWQTMGCGYWRDVSWFLINAVAAMGETVVTKWWCVRRVHSAGAEKSRPTGAKGRVYRGLGFMWVFGFLFWSVPKWEYGKIYCVVQQMEM